MKYLFVLLLISGCWKGQTKITTDTIEWIKAAEKPVAVYQDFDTYTLIAADGEIYYTGRMQLQLPDTIY